MSNKEIQKNISSSSTSIYPSSSLQPSTLLTSSTISSYTNVSKPELRGITIRQLRNICQEIHYRCEAEDWKRSIQGVVIPLEPEEVNFYDLNDHFIAPQTLQYACSYVELVTNSSVSSQQRKPEWFVSHWCGMPVLDFLACLEQHAFDRNLDPETTPYWIYMFAHNHHEISDDDSNSDLTKHSFFKAMQLCKGVVSIVDQKSISFTRVWPNFEISLALSDLAYGIYGRRERKLDRELSIYNSATSIVSQNEYRDDAEALLYDIYTKSNHGSAVGLTEGIVASDMFPRRNDGSLDVKGTTTPNQYYGMKLIRESQFPYQVCIKALSIQIETSSASCERDTKRILNFITGRTQKRTISGSNDDEDSEVPLTHEYYTYINKLLRSKFAIAIYRTCLEEGRNVELIRRAISEAPLEKLELSFHGVRQCSTEAPKLIKALPTSLKALDFRFSMQLFQTAADFAVGFHRLTNLQSMKLDCSTCTLTSCKDLWTEIYELKKLEILDLNFSYNQYLQSIKGLGRTITQLRNLKELRLNFHRCSNIVSIHEFVMGLSEIERTTSSSLRLLQLNFDHTSLTQNDVLELCNELIMSTTFESDKSLELRLSFEPLLNLHSVKNVQDLRRKLLELRCCDKCVVS